MESKLNMEAFWNEWISELMPWLFTHGVRIILILIGTFILNAILQKLITKVVEVTVTADRHQSEAAEKMRERTLIRIFSWTIQVILVIIVIMFVLHEFGLPIAPMLAGAGILGIAVGFGGQYLIRDFFTGFFMILENQYRIGDAVSLDQTSGMVENISLRMTTLRDLDGTLHHVPHGDIKRVANMSMDFSRININIRVSYETPLEKAIEVINKTGNELASDPAFKEFIIKAPQFLRVDDFIETGMVLKVLGETVPLAQWNISGELRKRLKIAFDHEGIQIPAVLPGVQKLIKNNEE